VKRDELNEENLSALEKGFVNLQKHMDIMKTFGVPFVVAVNRFESDTPAEIGRVLELCRGEGVRVAVSEVFAKGGEGGLALAEEVIEAIEEGTQNHQPLYPLDLPILEKIEIIAKEIFGASAVAMEGKIRRRIRRIERRGFKDLPICIAKTQYSLSDDDEALGRPDGFTLIVTDASLSSGAGFVVIYCGDIMTMPGLPKIPSAERIGVGGDGEITGLS
jgi:formate--tetrahydrofolate ligase